MIADIFTPIDYFESLLLLADANGDGKLDLIAVFDTESGVWH